MRLSKAEEFKLIEIKAKEQSYSLLSGNHISKMYGEGYDFGELREYQIGDDIRKINWTISAKMQKPFIKELHSNRELSVCVTALISPSLYFGLEDTKMVREKQNLITEIYLLLGYSTVYNQDLFTGVYYFNNKSYLTPPTKQRYTIEKFAEKIYNLNIKNSTLDYNISKDLFSKIINRSIIFIIGDFLEDIDLSILSKRHEVVVIIVRHRDELNPKALGEVILKNPSNQEEKSSFFGNSIIEKYIKELKKSDDKLYNHLNQFNIKYINIDTGDNILDKFNMYS
ncbi:hypothetical protein MNB_SV-9-1618 [hydrothermal vent metagenome]|uniref:DUF58 domain-containing protein n=1 Tax=hydrothermal vent metagenome TaxID=652676 RepID=A0A1W1BPZ9_9ZZZZ